MSQTLAFNGIDASTGAYAAGDLLPHDLTRLAQGRPIAPRRLEELAKWLHRVREKFLGPAEGVDGNDLAQAGWGVIFPARSDPAIQEALKDLIEHRRGEAGPYCRVFAGQDGVQPSDKKEDFLVRHGAAPGQPADPRHVPYYLLIVGGPEDIPFSFQYHLDVQYAVGRIHFDTVEEYANYARTVVDFERGEPRMKPSAAFFGTRNHDDRATGISATDLLGPLSESFAREHPAWQIRTAVGDQATKAELVDLLGGDGTPSLLFTATHGATFPPRHPRQAPSQGALVCQDWPGPRRWRGALLEDHYVHGGDIPDDADLRGLIAFHFACFCAGTPQFDESKPDSTAQLAERPFVAGLPKRLLGHPKGALAVIGHVDRAWGYSFRWPRSGQQTEVFRSCLAQVAKGNPIGFAFEFFNMRYAELATDLAADLKLLRQGRAPDHEATAFLWTAHNDARDYAILGDPAVRCTPGKEGDAKRHTQRTQIALPADPGHLPATEPGPGETHADQPAPAGTPTPTSAARLAESLRAATWALDRAAEDLAALEAELDRDDGPPQLQGSDLLATASSSIAELLRRVKAGP